MRSTPPMRRVSGRGGKPGKAALLHLPLHPPTVNWGVVVLLSVVAAVVVV